MRQTLFFLLFLGAALTGLTGCIEDGVSTSVNEQPVFSTDTLRLGRVWTGAPTPTSRFTVYNRHDKILNLSRVAFSDDPDCHYRLNVDGTAGREVTNVEIRPNDSIFVFVEATLPQAGRPGNIPATAHIEFLVNGRTSSVVVAAEAADIKQLKGVVVSADTTFPATYPLQIFDSLVVAPGATLTLAPGSRLHFHDGARMVVRGTLLAPGTAEQPIDMTGDRNGNVVASIPYDIMAGQWQGLTFASGSRGNKLTFTTVRNSVDGLCVDSLAQLELRSSIIRNAASRPLSATGASVKATGCEIAEGGSGVIYLRGGDVSLDHCTVANHYLFSAISGPAIYIDRPKDTDARITNTIIYGIGDDLNLTDLGSTPIVFDHCLFKSKGSDDDNFRDCLWESDPLYMLDRQKYIFDYRLKQGSPALGKAVNDGGERITGPDGSDITLHIGAYAGAM